MQIQKYDDFIQEEKKRNSDGSLCLVAYLLIHELKFGDVISPVTKYYFFKPRVLWFA